MSSLHVINKTDTALWQSCSAALKNGDSLLLIEDAVYAVLPENGLATAVVAAGVQLQVLAEDLAVRGISARIRTGFKPASYKDFVTLSLAHDRVVSWQ